MIWSGTFVYIYFIYIYKDQWELHLSDNNTSFTIYLHNLHYWLLLFTVQDHRTFVLLSAVQNISKNDEIIILLQFISQTSTAVFSKNSCTDSVKRLYHMDWREICFSCNKLRTMTWKQIHHFKVRSRTALWRIFFSLSNA